MWKAHEYRTTAPWRLDFGKLHQFAGGNESDISRAILYGSHPPPNDSLWDLARQKGFEIVVYDRNASNREKKVDTTIARDITKDSLTAMKPGVDYVTLVAGDADYVPIAEDLVERGITFDVYFWDQTSAELKAARSHFVSLNAYLDFLRFEHT